MKSESKDRIRNVLVTAASALPWAGGPLAVILDKYLPNELERRKASLIAQIAEDLRLLEDRVGKLALDTPEMLSTFMKVFRHGIEEHKQEKIIAFRNILLNTAISSGTEFNERDFYIRLVDALTVDQLRILHLIYKRDIEQSLTLGEDNNVYRYVEQTWPSVDEYYIQACFTELIRYYIISSSSKLAREKGVKGHLLTGFGERFIRFIFSPIEMIEDEADQHHASVDS